MPELRVAVRTSSTSSSSPAARAYLPVTSLDRDGLCRILPLGSDASLDDAEPIGPGGNNICANCRELLNGDSVSIKLVGEHGYWVVMCHDCGRAVIEAVTLYV